MAQYHTSTTFTASELRVFYDMTLLQEAKFDYIHDKFGKRVTVPQGYGSNDNSIATVNFRRFVKIPVGTPTALTEGTAGANMAFSITTVNATLPQYGAWIQGTDVLNDLAMDSITTEVTEKLSDHAYDTLDQVTRAILRAGTTVIYGASSASRGAVASLLTVDLLKKAAFTLKKNGAKPWVFGGKQRYPAITGPEFIYDLIKDSTIATAMQYAYGNDLSADKNNLFDGSLAPEIDIVGVRLFTNLNAATRIGTSTGLSYVHVYCTLVFGKDAYGVIEQDGRSMKRYYIPTTHVDKSDILQQNWYMGWKACHNAVILNQSNMVRIEHGYSGDI